MRPQRFSCGIQVRELHLTTELAASMRPQRFSCGIVHDLLLGQVSQLGFNEAAAFQLRNPAPNARMICSRCCFNEAAAFQLRNRSPGRASYSPRSGFNEAAAFQLRNPRLNVVGVRL